MGQAGKKIRVLVVDDSAIVRKLLTDAIAAEPDMEVVGTAPDPFVARDKILQLKPDVLTLDIEMPRMDGLTFLRQLMKHHPLPTVMISSLCQSSAQQTLEALRLGAVEVFAKPGGPYSVGELQTTLAMKIRAAAMARIRREVSEPVPAPIQRVHAEMTRPATATPSWNPKMVIAIGASTGGPEALRQVLTAMPADIPPMVITQHIPPIFSKAFADRMDGLCAFEVKEAVDGDEARPNRVLIAPGNFHMVLRRTSDGLRVAVKDGPPVCYSRPSVDVLFSSVAEACGASAVGVIMTGMGKDGAQGMLKMKRAGAATIAQDEQSCVVFGMPREAIQLGCVDKTVALEAMADTIVAQVRLGTAH